MSIIEFKNVSYSYNESTHALKDVSLSIEEGSFVAIIGSNGSGKSTLARCINALILPDTGQVLTNGYDTLDSNNTYLIRQNVGMVLQNPDDQIVSSIVEDEVAFGPENLSVPPVELRIRVSESLEQVGLAGYELNNTHALSGGQKQRLAIASCLAIHPKILVLDEASSMLDPRGRNSLIQLCKKLNAKGLTIIYVTHFMEEAAQADRVIALHNGVISMDGTPAEVLTKTDALNTLGLKPPFAVSLSEKLQIEGIPVRVQLSLEALATEVKELMPANKFAAKFLQNSIYLANPSKQCQSKNLIRFDNVSYAYDGINHLPLTPANSSDIADPKSWGGVCDDKWAIHDVNFSIDSGDFIGIAGHTGSGKSTLVQLAAGLLNSTEGKVSLEDKNLSNKKTKRELLGSTIGYLFQYPEQQLFAPTVFEDVAFGPKNLGLKEVELETRVKSALDSVGLNDVAQKSPFELSGGQQRRVALAGVLAMSPKVLILDEPTAGLDPCARDEIMALISQIREVSNITMIMVSHSMDNLAKFCNKILILDKGQIAEFGSPSQVFSDPAKLNNLGLNQPSMLNFLRLLSEVEPCDNSINGNVGDKR